MRKQLYDNGICLYGGAFPLEEILWRLWLPGGNPDLFLFNDKYLGFTRFWFSLTFHSIIPFRGNGL